MKVAGIGRDGDENLASRDDEGTTDEASELAKDEIFGVLKNRRRRRIIEYLLTHEEGATRSEIAEHIAALENDVDVSLLSSSERKRVYVSLYQTHLPKLAETGLIEYDRDRGHVSPTERIEQLTRYLDTDGGNGASPEFDTQHYLVVSLLGGALLFLTSVFHAVSPLSSSVVAATLVVVFLAMSVWETSRRLRVRSRRLAGSVLGGD
ncbi:MAG: ArsR family transcriptional regulator [Salinigranum sp.]